MNIFKQQFLLHLIGISISSGAVVTFSDSVDVISGSPSYTLDSTPYGNSIIGTGEWFVDVTFSSTINSFEVAHSIFLFSSGSLDTVTVFGTTSGAVELTANAGFPTEEGFSGTAGVLPNEHVFDLSGYNLNQGGNTLFSGFDSISTINFSGSYTSVPEPSASMLLVTTMVSLTFRRRRFRRINKAQ